MAAVATDLVKCYDTGKGRSHYTYWTTDTIATVDSAGYFNNGDDDLVLRVGDTIQVMVVNSIANPTSVTDAGLVIVNAAALEGIVDTSDETANTVTDTD